MVGLALQRDVGAVGARLWFADGTLQHAGVVFGIGGVAGHVHRQLPRSQPRLPRPCAADAGVQRCDRRLYGVAARGVRRSGGLDEVNLAVDYNDIDFCLRIRRAGYRVVWTPHAQLYHHESATRGRDRSDASQRRYRPRSPTCERSGRRCFSTIPPTTRT